MSNEDDKTSYLDSNLLAGKLNVDDYASLLLQNVKKQREVVPIAEFEALEKERNSLRELLETYKNNHANSKDTPNWYLNTFSDELSVMNTSGNGEVSEDMIDKLSVVIEDLKLKLKEQTAAAEEQQRAFVVKLKGLKEIAENECNLRVAAHELVSEFLIKETVRKHFLHWKACSAGFSKNRTISTRHYEKTSKQKFFKLWISYCRNLKRANAFRRKHALRIAFSTWKNNNNVLPARSSSSQSNPSTAAMDGGNASSAGSNNKKVTSLVNLAALRSMASKQKLPALFLAASKGMPDAVLKLIEDGSPVNMSARPFQETPLHACVQSGSVEVCEILLEYGANVSAVDEDGNTPLIWCARAGDASVGVATCLLKHGSDPRKSLKAALHYCVDSKAHQIADLIVKYDRKTVFLQMPESLVTPLHLACFKADVELVQIMLNSQKSVPLVDSPLDFLQKSALHYACASESLEAPRVMQQLIEFGYYNDVNLPCKPRNETPLMFYCKNEHSVPETILNVFYRPTNHTLEVDLMDTFGNTALHLACERNNRKVALALVQIGAPLYIVNNKDESPLDLVAPAFAIELLAAITVKPFLHKAERNLKRLKNCMICKELLKPSYVLPKSWIVDICRRCGRLCCANCLVHEERGLLSSAVSKTASVAYPSFNSDILCKHCSEFF